MHIPYRVLTVLTALFSAITGYRYFQKVECIPSDLYGIDEPICTIETQPHPIRDLMPQGTLSFQPEYRMYPVGAKTVRFHVYNSTNEEAAISIYDAEMQLADSTRVTFCFDISAEEYAQSCVTIPAHSGTDWDANIAIYGDLLSTPGRYRLIFGTWEAEFHIVGEDD
jgi:hypothetical protein